MTTRPSSFWFHPLVAQACDEVDAFVAKLGRTTKLSQEDEVSLQSLRQKLNEAIEAAEREEREERSEELRVTALARGAHRRGGYPIKR